MWTGTSISPKGTSVRRVPTTCSPVQCHSEQFSDGVGYRWIDSLKAHAEAQVSDRALAEAADRFPMGTPTTKEAYFYREVFESHFPSASAAATVPVQDSVACSSPAALAWDPSFQQLADPSGRAVRGVHIDSYGDDSG